MTHREQKLKKAKTAQLMVCGAFVIIVSVCIFCVHFTRQKITSVSDLETVHGPLQRYSFRDGARGTHSYYIFLEGDNNRYQIPADFLGCFDKDGFESTAVAGDVLTIAFNKRFFVFSVFDSKRSYLAADSAIAEYNGGTDIRVSIFLFIIGSAVLAGGLIRQRNAALSAKMAPVFSKSLPAPIAIALILFLSLAAILWLARTFGL